MPNVHFIAYNPALGNALVGVSDQPLPETEGLIYEIIEGLGDISALEWNPILTQFQPKRQRLLSRKEFLQRLSLSEYAAIKAAAAQSAAVDYYWQMFMLVGNVDLDSNDTVTGMNLLEQSGMLGEGRAAEILA